MFYIQQTHSTNDLLKTMLREQQLPEGFVVQTDFQTAGKGQSGNSWESAEGENLLFSMVLYPRHIPVEQQFLISQLVSVAVKNTLDTYTDNITVKWPNDIYWNNKKLGGILIENSLQSGAIKSTVIGIGLNVNQQKFVSNAPNPISLRQITNNQHDISQLLLSIRNNILHLYNTFDIQDIQQRYQHSLYRKTGYHAYRVENDIFQAQIIAVHPDGQLELETDQGERLGFYFKEVQFVV